MFLQQKLIFPAFILLGMVLMAGNAAAQSTRSSASGPATGAGPASDVDTGLTVQYRRYHFFIKDDTFALDVRGKNLYNGGRPTPSYFNLGGYIEYSRDHDLLGTSVPIGVVIGMDKRFQAYIQAEPNIDLNDDKDIKTGGAVGIRFQF